MIALASASAVRLTASVSPACAASSPASIQHMTAAPAGTQASSSAPTSPSQGVGAPSTSATARTLLKQSRVGGQLGA